MKPVFESKEAAIAHLEMMRKYKPFEYSGRWYLYRVLYPCNLPGNWRLCRSKVTVKKASEKGTVECFICK